MSELLDCPFCGCEPDFLLDEDNCPYVTCHSCQFSMPAYRPGFEHMAIAAWNRRAAPAAGTVEKDAELADVLNTTLWLYRRLPQAYGKPPFVDLAILKMAERLGLDDVPAALKERAALLDNANARSPSCGS